MQTERDYYHMLGIRPNASQEDIRRAYYRLAMQFHPDKNADANAQARFQEINEAYEVLKDPQRVSHHPFPKT